MRSHLFSACALALALWVCLPSIAHARRGIPLFLIISDNPILLVVGLGLVGVWAYARSRDD